MPLKVLILSRNYPSHGMPLLGLWAERTTQYAARMCEVKVVAPVPYCPPLPSFLSYVRFRRIAWREQVHGIDVVHPRFLIGPGYSFHSIEADTYYWSIRHKVDELRREFPFDLIHAHFTYPDGVVAARLGIRYGVPAVITEHAPWRPWMAQYPRVRRQAIWASKTCAFHIAPSRFVEKTIIHFSGESENLRIIPNGVDCATFSPEANGQQPLSNELLFVGIMRHVKGVDVLLKALRLLVDQGRKVKLSIVGDSFYQSYRRDHKLLRQLARELALEKVVQFLGPKSPQEVARYMRQSSLLVLPSRAESFGVVLAESLACGTPVVATRCGGPEDIVNDQVGVLVAPEDPEALADGISSVLAGRAEYDPHKLHSYALQKFGLESVGLRVFELYREAINSSRQKLPVSAHV